MAGSVSLHTAPICGVKMGKTSDQYAALAWKVLDQACSEEVAWDELRDLQVENYRLRWELENSKFLMTRFVSQYPDLNNPEINAVRKWLGPGDEDEILFTDPIEVGS